MSHGHGHGLVEGDNKKIAILISVLALFLAVSLVTEPGAVERRQAERFVSMRAAAPGDEGWMRAASLWRSYAP